MFLPIVPASTIVSAWKEIGAKQQAADNAHAKPQRRRYRGKAHGKRQQPLRDAVEHDADRRKDIL